jgi:hypothetical protein
MNQLRCEFDKKCSDVAGVQAVFAKLAGPSSQTFQIPIDSIRLLVRNFSIFSRRHGRGQISHYEDDSTRMAILLSYFRQSAVDQLFRSNGSSSVDDVTARQILNITRCALERIATSIAQLSVAASTLVPSGAHGSFMASASTVLNALVSSGALASTSSDRSLFNAACRLLRVMVELRSDHKPSDLAHVEDGLLSSLCQFVMSFLEHSPASAGDGDGDLHRTAMFEALVEHVISIPNIFLVATKTPALLQFRVAVCALLVSLRQSTWCGGWDALFQVCSDGVLRATVADGGLASLHAASNLVLFISHGDCAGPELVLDPLVYDSALSAFLCGDSVVSRLFFQTLWKALVRSQHEGVALVPFNVLLGVAPQDDSASDNLVSKYDELMPTDCNKCLDLLIESHKQRNSSTCGLPSSSLETIRYVLCYFVYNAKLSGELLRRSLNDCAAEGASPGQHEKAQYVLSAYSRLVLGLPTGSTAFTKAINQLRVAFRGTGAHASGNFQGIAGSMYVRSIASALLL